MLKVIEHVSIDVLVTIGGDDTLMTRSMEFITNMRTSTGSHECIAVVELFGRYSGETSLISAYLAYVDRAIISEVPFNVEKLARLLLEDKRNNPSSPRAP